MNNKQTSPNKIRHIYLTLASAIAETLNCSEAPAELTATLLEAVDPLSDLLAPKTPNALTVIQLRGLVNGGMGKTRPRIEKRNGRHSERSGRHQTREAEKTLRPLAKASAIQ